ncbi:hypothetical protein LTR50_006893 [Elasticomyces elasticus]|nr:hypothetical protein LTR50_006893 [Elasticomyces elasticus]
MSRAVGRGPQEATGSRNIIELEPSSSQNSDTGNLPRNIHVRVAHDEGENQYSCNLLAIDAANQGEDLMIKLHEMDDGESRCLSRFIRACGDAFLMQQDSVWLVSFSPLTSSVAADPEAQAVLHPIYVKHSECSEPLTQAFHHPEQLRSAKNFVYSHLEGIIDSSRLAWAAPRQALYLRKSFGSKAAFIWFGNAFVLSTGAGIGAGLAKHDSGLSIAVGTGMLALLSAIQCLLIWHNRSARM